MDLVRRSLLAGRRSLCLRLRYPQRLPGSAGSQIVPQLRQPAAPELDADLLLGGGFPAARIGERVVWKPRKGAFYRTGPEEQPRGLGASTVVVTGCDFPNCPRTTVMEASERELRVVLASDAVSGAVSWHLPEPRRIGVLPATTAEIARAWRPPGEVDLGPRWPWPTPGRPLWTAVPTLGDGVGPPAG